MNSLSKFQGLVLAGLIGGLAEVVWISLYAFVTGTPLAPIATAITATVYPAGSALSLAPIMGLLIHMSLSVLLALGFGVLIWPLVQRVFAVRHTALLASVITLALVWKINFFVLLPVWNPAFIELLPLSATLISKLLFGVAMGSVLTVYSPKTMA